MGNNLPDCSRRRSSERMSQGDESPADTEEYYNQGMPLQQFELRVSNIRLKNVPLVLLALFRNKPQLLSRSRTFFKRPLNPELSRTETSG